LNGHKAAAAPEPPRINQKLNGATQPTNKPPRDALEIHHGFSAKKLSNNFQSVCITRASSKVISCLSLIAVNESGFSFSEQHRQQQQL
jgi:hypothetical protein